MRRSTSENSRKEISSRSSERRASIEKRTIPTLAEELRMGTWAAKAQVRSYQEEGR